MMYNQGLAAAIRLSGKGGKILREFGSTVYMPFGSEYEIVLNNKQATRASVRVEIDGQDVLDGHAILIQPNSSFNLERFIRRGNLNEGNRFKFIERTSKVEAGRGGIKVDDGLIRIEYQFERPAPVITTTWTYDTHHHHHHHHHDYYDSWPGKFGTTGGLRGVGPLMNSTLGGGATSAQFSATASANSVKMKSATRMTKGVEQEVKTSSSIVMPEVNEAGITAAGSRSNQNFQLTSAPILLPQVHVIVLELKGRDDEVEVVKPVTVKSKITCSVCKTRNKATAKFCSECSAALELL